MWGGVHPAELGIVPAVSPDVLGSDVLAEQVLHVELDDRPAAPALHHVQNGEVQPLEEREKKKEQDA